MTAGQPVAKMRRVSRSRKKFHWNCAPLKYKSSPITSSSSTIPAMGSSHNFKKSMYLLVSVKDIKRSENTFFPPNLQTQRLSERRRTSHFPVHAGPKLLLHFFSALCFVLPVEHTLFRLVFFFFLCQHRLSNGHR